MNSKIYAMNTPFEELLWVGSKTYKPAVGKSKEGDQAWLPDKYLGSSLYRS